MRVEQPIFKIAEIKVVFHKVGKFSLVIRALKFIYKGKEFQKAVFEKPGGHGVMERVFVKLMSKRELILSKRDKVPVENEEAVSFAILHMANDGYYAYEVGVGIHQQ